MKFFHYSEVTKCAQWNFFSADNQKEEGEKRQKNYTHIYIFKLPLIPPFFPLTFNFFLILCFACFVSFIFLPFLFSYLLTFFNTHTYTHAHITYSINTLLFTPFFFPQKIFLANRQTKQHPLQRERYKYNLTPINSATSIFSPFFLHLTINKCHTTIL